VVAAALAAQAAVLQPASPLEALRQALYADMPVGGEGGCGTRTCARAERGREGYGGVKETRKRIILN
jgi:hypothetical protein